MSNYNNSKKFSILSAVAIIIAVLLIAGAVLGVGYHYGWFSKTDDETENTQEVSNGGAVISDGENNGLQLLAATLTANNSVESSYTLTATPNPSTATITGYTWSVSWDTSFSGYSASGSSKDINGSSWITGISSADISDYVTLSSTTGSSVTVSCLQAFGNPIIIKCTATSYNGSTVSGTVNVDYQSRITGVSDFTLFEYDVSYSDTSELFVYNSDDYLTLPSYSATRYDENSYYLCVSDNGTSLNGVYLTYGTGSKAADYTISTITITSNSDYFKGNADSVKFSGVNSYIGWDDFCNDLFGYYASQDQASLYSVLQTCYSAGADAITITFSVTDNFTGTVTNCSYGAKVNPARLATAASSVSLNYSSLVF